MRGKACGKCAEIFKNYFYFCLMRLCEIAEATRYFYREGLAKRIIEGSTKMGLWSHTITVIPSLYNWNPQLNKTLNLLIIFDES